jgi:hypothetical protein
LLGLFVLIVEKTAHGFSRDSPLFTNGLESVQRSVMG